MLKRTPQNVEWPSGSYVDVATISVAPAQVEAALGGNLVRGEEPGLGTWVAIGIVAPSGAVIELVQYAEAPVKGVFTVRIDAGANHHVALEELLVGLDLSRSHVAWLSASVGE